MILSSKKFILVYIIYFLYFFILSSTFFLTTFRKNDVCIWKRSRRCCILAAYSTCCDLLQKTGQGKVIARTQLSPKLRESKTVLDSGFHAVDYGFQVLDSVLFARRTWILDSGFLEMYSRFQSPGFRILQAKRKQPTFGDATTGFPAKWRLRNERTNSILMSRHYPDLGSASDRSCRGGKFYSTNQKHYPDLGSDASSVRNFYARFSDVIWRGNQW